mmetsp:Transcript_19954/g.46426  ORF Transcript_19954/g.46426 Transcript_19954/m.46426 type:complete len:666 (-) Transcript_19954:36-2033(-)
MGLRGKGLRILCGAYARSRCLLFLALAQGLQTLAAAAEVLSAASAGCDFAYPGLREFLQLTKTYYSKGIFTLADKERVQRILGVAEAIQAICPAAYLQALLIKLEENLVYDSRSYRNILDVYIRELHAGIASEQILPADLHQWPLQVGFERVTSLAASLQFKKTLRSAMVLNFCQVQDRFGEVHALDWILNAPFGWLEEGDDEQRFNSKRRAGLLQDTDLFMYLVNSSHCRPPASDLVEALQRSMRSVQLIPYTGGPSREEQSAYFKYIVDHYDSLPDFTIFVHPDSPEHQGQRFEAMSRALTLIKTGSELAEKSLGYYPIALQMVVDPKRTWGEEYREHWRDVWERLFDGDWPFRFEPPQCHWTEHLEKYIAGTPVSGDVATLPRSRAKMECQGLGSLCAGVTCEVVPMVNDDSDEEQRQQDPLLLEPIEASWVELPCTTRAGDPAGLWESPSNEKSLVKTCNVSSRDGESSIAEQQALLSASQTGRRRPSVYGEKMTGVYLPDFAAGDSTVYADLATARSACDRLGDRCGGLTCEFPARVCTCRAGREGLPSPAGEVSYLKVSGRILPGADTARGASSKFQSYMGSHAIVHKDRIRLRSREEYANLAADLQFCSDATGQMEALWHAFFGEPLSQWPRELDPRLPLFLKWGVQTLYHYGDEGVI